MISFRAKSEHGMEWNSVSIEGEHEDMLAHAIATQLNDAGWEILVSEAGGEFEQLDEGWL